MKTVPCDNPSPASGHLRLITTAPDAPIRDQPSINMTLLGRAVSVPAIEAMQALEARIAPAATESRKTRTIDTNTLGTACADFLRAMACDPPSLLYRPLAAGSFADASVGHKAFKRIVDRLAAHRFVIVERGQAALGKQPGTVTRLRPTLLLSDFLARYGISASNRKSHFAYVPTYLTLSPLRLKATSRRNMVWDKIPGKLMPVDYTDQRAADSARMVQELNAFAALNNTFSIDEEVVFFRGYNLGDDPAFAYNKGGRLYCLRAGYQGYKQERRKDILINGNSTVELDISACYITIAHKLIGELLPHRADIYDLPGLDRQIVKMFVTALLGAGKRPLRWSADHRNKYERDNPTKRLQKEHPIDDVGNTILGLMPILKNIVEHGIGWADLQFLESEIVINTIHKLAMNDKIMALPVHDSIIVESHNLDRAKEVLSETFFKQTGIIPNLIVKS